MSLNRVYRSSLGDVVRSVLGVRGPGFATLLRIVNPGPGGYYGMIFRPILIGSLGVDDDGNVVGMTYPPATGQGVIKIAPDANVVWVAPFLSNDQNFREIHVNGDGSAIICGKDPTSGHGMVRKIDNTGATVWNYIHGTGSPFDSLIMDGSGNIYLVIRALPTVVKLDSTGAFVWQYVGTWGEADYLFLSGSYVCVGALLLDAAAGTLSHTYAPTGYIDVSAYGSDGSHVIYFCRDSTTSAFTVLYSSAPDSDSVSWHWAPGKNMSRSCFDSSGNVFVTTSDTSGPCVYMLSSSGANLWNWTSPGDGCEECFCQGTELYITGKFRHYPVTF